MKPMIFLPPETMSQEDIKTLRENDICVVVASDPSKVKFVEAIPEVAARTKIENAAIQLSRRLLKGEMFPANRKDFASLYVDCLIAGTPLDVKPTQQEMEQQAYDMERIEEFRRLAREDAKLERAAAKVQKSNKP